MGSGGGNKGGPFSGFINNVASKGGAAGAPAFDPSRPNLPYANDPYRPNNSYTAGPSYGNYQLPYNSGPFGSNYIPTPGGGEFGPKGGTMSPGFAPPSYGMMMNTLNYGRYPGSGIGYYDPTPEQNYNPSRRSPPSRKGGPDIPYVGLPKTPFPTPMPYPEMPGPPAKGLPTPAVQPIQPKGGAF
jgi:hypothetical protein